MHARVTVMYISNKCMSSLTSQYSATCMYIHTIHIHIHNTWELLDLSLAMQLAVMCVCSHNVTHLII